MGNGSYDHGVYKSERGRNYLVGRCVDPSIDPGLAKVVQKDERVIPISSRVKIETPEEREDNDTLIVTSIAASILTVSYFLNLWVGDPLNLFFD